MQDKAKQWNKSQFSNFKQHGTTKIKFEGRIPELKGHLYDSSGPSQAYHYTKTTREIAGYVATTFKNGMMSKW